MKKHLLLGLLAALLLCVSAAAVDNAQEQQIRNAVSKVITNYAASVYQPDAADEAFEDFMIQGFFVNSGTMPVNERDPIVSSIFNACVMQDALTRAITAMQELDLDSLYLAGGPGWHNYYYNYSYYGYRGTEKVGANRIGTMTSAKTVYGDNHYAGPVNRNDDVLELLVGDLSTRCTLRLEEIRNGTAVYSAALEINDDFNFTSDYSSIAKKGFDTSKDNRLVNLGLMLKLFGLSDFYWEFQKTLTIEVPLACGHSSGSYQWSYDPETATLTPGSESTPNGVERLEYVSTSTGAVSYYFKLDDPITLRHDEPWVVEMDMQPAGSLVLAATVSNGSCFPYIYQYSRLNTWVGSYEYILPQKGDTTSKTSSYTYHYSGVDLKDQFKYSGKRLYTYRLENTLAADGSNMPYLSVYDHQLQQTVYGPAPMDDYWVRHKGDEGRTLTSTEDPRLSGEDIIINYIGNKSARVPKSAHFDLRIWENGEDRPNSSSFITTSTAPTCTSAGSATHTCRDCGYSYTEETAPALGHVYDDKLDGTCNTCGETRELPRLEGDVNGDGIVNIIDMGLFRLNFGRKGSAILHDRADVNGDGMVNIMDMGVFRANFGKSI